MSMVIAKTASRNVAFKAAKMGESVLQVRFSISDVITIETEMATTFSLATFTLGDHHFVTDLILILDGLILR